MSALHSPSDVQTALERWLLAMNHPADPGLLRAAVTEDFHLERHHPIARASLGTAPRAEELRGTAAVARWLTRSPAGTVFSLAGPAALDGAALRVEYTITVKDFCNGGLWLARLDGGRLCWLAHHPAALES